MPVKAVNVPHNVGRVTIGGHIKTTLTTQLPGKPQLFTSCATPLNAKTRVNRAGELVPHGNKLYVPQIDCQNAPTVCDGTNAVWLQPPCCPPGKPCYWFAADLGATPPLINWSTVLHPCEDLDPPDRAFYGNAPGGVDIANQPYRDNGWVQVENPTNLPFNGGQVSLPSSGSVSVSTACAFNFLFGPLSGSSRGWIEGMPYDAVESQIFINDGRPCSAAISIGKRVNITAPGCLASGQARATGANLFFQIVSPGFLTVEWWADPV